MVTITHSRQESAAERFLALLGHAFARIVAVMRAAQNRRAVAQLLEWDDHMLRDIGLTRGDVRAVMATRVVEDPSCHLEALSSERRIANRALARERLVHAGRPGRRSKRGVLET